MNDRNDERRLKDIAARITQSFGHRVTDVLTESDFKFLRNYVTACAELTLPKAEPKGILTATWADGSHKTWHEPMAVSEVYMALVTYARPVRLHMCLELMGILP